MSWSRCTTRPVASIPAALPEHPEVTKPDRLKFERGLGIPLMRELTDEIGFRREGEGTTVRLMLTAHLRT